MDQYKASTPIPTAVSPPSSPSSSEPLNTSPPIRSDSEVTQGSSIPQVQPNASLEVAQAEEGGKDDDVERGSNSVSTTQDKGKGRAIGEALTDMGNGPEELARALAGFKMPEKVVTGENQGSNREPSEVHETVSSQDLNPPSLPDRIPHSRSKPEKLEEEWLLKSIAWPPLPPRPASSEGGQFETCETLRVKIIQQNLNGPCSLIALCNILILRNDLEIAPGRDRVTYSYLSTLLANYFLQITSSSSVPPSPALTHLPSTRQLSLEAALSILPQTRVGLNLNPQFTKIDGFTSSPSSGEGELALFSLAQIPLLHGWLGDPADEETYRVLEEAGDYDRAVEMMVEGSEVAGKLGLEGNGGVDLNDEELIREAERRSQWTSEEEEKVRKAHLVNLFLNATSTQLTYTGLFALSSAPSLLPPAGLAACFRNGHLSVLYRRPRTPSTSSESYQTPCPELFTLVTDSSFAGEEQIVWESIEDVDGSASEFFTAGLERSRTKGGDWAGVRNVADLPEHARRNEGNEMADLALAQQLQAEEEDRADAFERAEQRRYQESQRSNEPPSASSTVHSSSRRTSHSATTAGGRQGGQGGENASTGKGSKLSKPEKDKCLVM